MRTGLDVRRYHKPSVFVELVDTRWDEYNRIAEMNLTSGMVDPNSVMIPVSPPANGAGTPPPAMIAPPAGGGSGDSGRNAEPDPLPGAPVEPLPPSPGAGPTAQRPLTLGPSLLPPAAGDSRTRADDDGTAFDDDADNDQDNGADFVRLSSHSPSSGRRAAEAGSRTAGQIATAAPGEKPALRPAASRLFSRPR